MTDSGGMIRAGWLRGWATLLVVAALVLRLMGPGGGLPAREGYVAICAGSEIIYIPISELGFPPLDDAPAQPVADHCPWFFQFHPLPVAPFEAVFRALPVSVVAHVVPPVPHVEDRTPAAFHARGPPALRA